MGKLLYWVFMANFILLLWLGSKTMEKPYMLISMISSFFIFYLLFQ